MVLMATPYQVEESCPEPTLFLPCFQNPDGHSFLTKEELLQKCAQKAPRVSIQLRMGRERPLRSSFMAGSLGMKPDPMMAYG